MRIRDDLVIGQYYWILPEPDEESREAWEDDLQPARYAGKNVDGQLLWNFIGIDGCTNWSVVWIGEAINKPQFELPPKFPTGRV
jgi:hypothetical protein